MERVVDPTGVMASTLSVGVAPHSSPNAPAMSRSNDSYPGDMTPKTAPMTMSPLLLASVCCGSSGALKFLLDREDAQDPPMVVPTQAFVDLLVGYIPGSSTGGRRLAVQQASDDVEHGVHQSALPATTSGDLEDGVHQPALPATARLLRGLTAEGNTALHVVASHGDSTEFLKCASVIDERDQGLLFAVNKKGDTPLHCAARAGKSLMVSCLIELAKSCNRLHELVRKENDLKETALHDAVRIGRKDTVECLLEADDELANYPKEGTSPLYLAILLDKLFLLETLYVKSNGILSYSGPNGKNALHAAICRNSGTIQLRNGVGSTPVQLMLKWNNSLTTHRDGDGSTPLHLASSFRSFNHFMQLFEANPSQVYQADNNGLFPIHVAASVGNKNIVNIILKKFPSSAGLYTARGRTFLHVAVEKKRLNIVSFVSRTPSLAWILNMQDNDGNTALHLAVHAGKLQLFYSLYGNREVRLNLANNTEETPVELSKKYVPWGMHYDWNDEKQIYVALALFGTNKSGLRWDLFEEKYSQPLKPEDELKEAEKLKDSSQIVGLISVLIATVAFGASFAIPGGFIADDRTNRGTPVLAGRYTFDAFMMANALAFICSTISIMCLMYSGSSMVSLMSRRINLAISVLFISSSVTCLSTAFALGVYMVLAPVARATAMMICTLTPLIMLYSSLEFLVKLASLARPAMVRTGIFHTLSALASTILSKLFVELWPFIIIFSWAAFAQKLRNHLL